MYKIKYVWILTISEIVDVALRTMPLDTVDSNKSVDVWYYCRRGILAGTSNFIKERQAPTDLLRSTFIQIMQPIGKLNEVLSQSFYILGVHLFIA